MTDTAKIIAKMKRYASACDGHQIVDCKDICTLLEEIDRLDSLNEMRKELIQRHHAEMAGVPY